MSTTDDSDVKTVNTGALKLTSGSRESIWDSLKDNLDATAFTQIWLDTQVSLLDLDVPCALVVLLSKDETSFEPTAIWPDKNALRPAVASAAEDFIKRQPMELETQESASQVILTVPLQVYGKLFGAVVFQFAKLSSSALARAEEQLKWGVGWLEVYIHRNKYSSSDRLVTVLELLATGLHHEHFQSSATAVATELASVLACERVAIGFLNGNHNELAALSHSASFSSKAGFVRAIEAAMDEAIDQQTTVSFPPLENSTVQLTRAHHALSQKENNGAVCSIPLCVEQRIVGALVLQRSEDQVFDKSTIELCEHAASLLGPLLELKRKDDRWLGSKIAESANRQVKKLIGPKHAGFKLLSAVFVFLLLFFGFAQGDYRVTADARLEGTVQRSITSPVAGYVVEAKARAGDVVKQGDLLFALDDKDLRLERLKWVSQKLKNTREFNEATADHDRARARVLSAQVEQAEAEIALLDEQLKRTRLNAPFDGFVVSGDLSQSLGAPVERGDILFQIAPLDSYRVILEVDERDIDDVVQGQAGRLALASAPEDILELNIVKITPIATAEEGRNYFRVEAELKGTPSDLLRPGMEGVGKIYVEEKHLIWIWTYKIVHWMRMFFWSWWP